MVILTPLSTLRVRVWEALITLSLYMETNVAASGDPSVSSNLSTITLTSESVYSRSSTTPDLTTTDPSDSTVVNSGIYAAGNFSATDRADGKNGEGDSVTPRLSSSYSAASPSQSWWNTETLGSFTNLHLVCFSTAVISLLLIMIVIAVVIVRRAPYLCRLVKRRSILSDTSGNNTTIMCVNTLADLTSREPMDDLENLYDDSFLNSLETVPGSTAGCWSQPESGFSHTRF